MTFHAPLPTRYPQLDRPIMTFEHANFQSPKLRSRRNPPNSSVDSKQLIWHAAYKTRTEGNFMYDRQRIYRVGGAATQNIDVRRDAYLFS